VMALGGLWIVLWRGPVRHWGALPVAVALLLWVLHQRPPVLVSPDAVLVGLMGPEGRALSAPTGARFVASSWLENDGDLASQEGAAARAGFAGPRGERRFAIGPVRAVQLKGKGAPARLAAACATADLVILAAEAPAPPRGCTVIDTALLAETGTLAIWPEGASLRFVPTDAARRIWTGRAAPAATLQRLAGTAAPGGQ